MAVVLPEEKVPIIKKWTCYITGILQLEFITFTNSYNLILYITHPNLMYQYKYHGGFIQKYDYSKHA